MIMRGMSFASKVQGFFVENSRVWDAEVALYTACLYISYLDLVVSVHGASSEVGPRRGCIRRRPVVGTPIAGRIVDRCSHDVQLDGEAADLYEELFLTPMFESDEKWNVVAANNDFYYNFVRPPMTLCPKKV